MLRRIWRYLKALLTGKLAQWEDPEVLLAQAHQEMRENLARNKERAVEAITQKNRLKLMVEEGERKAANLQAQAELALKRGDRDLALRVMREKLVYDKTLADTKQSYEQAVQTAETVKVAIRREEEAFRQKLAERLAMVANWKQAQIQIAINKALEGMSVGDASETWERAQEKIMTAQSEAQARTELAAASVQAKIAELEDQAVDVEAEKALQELEARVMPGVQTQQVAASAEAGDAEQALAELEARIAAESAAPAEKPSGQAGEAPTAEPSPAPAQPTSGEDQTQKPDQPASEEGKPV